MIRIFRLGTRLIALVAFLCGAATAQADTTLVYQGADGQFTVDMRAGEVRIDDTGDEWQLYKADSGTILSIHPGDKSYTRLDKDAAGAIRARVDALRARIENRVQQLPQSQQATARAAMLQSVPGLDRTDQKIGLDQTGATETIAGVQCNVVQVIRGGEPAETLCVSGAKALGMSSQTFDTVQSMFRLMKTMLAGTGFETAGLPYLNLSGMPIRFTDSNTGQRRRLVKVSHTTLSDAHFSIPRDYIEQAPPSGQ